MRACIRVRTYSTHNRICYWYSSILYWCILLCASILYTGLCKSKREKGRERERYRVRGCTPQESLSCWLPRFSFQTCFVFGFVFLDMEPNVSEAKQGSGSAKPSSLGSLDRACSRPAASTGTRHTGTTASAHTDTHTDTLQTHTHTHTHSEAFIHKHTCRFSHT